MIEIQIMISPCIGGPNIDLVLIARKKYVALHKNVNIEVLYNEKDIKDKNKLLTAQLGYKWNIKENTGKTNIELNIMRDISEFEEIMSNLIKIYK
jgi:hypothetical protein